jgi:molecular chaperone DnaK
MKAVIGIDYGNGWIKIASLMDGSGQVYIIVNERGELATPSVLYCSKEGEIWLGADAIEQGYTDPTGCIKESKLKLGTTENLLKNGQVMTATDVAEKFFSHIKKWCEKKLCMEVSECVITVPANTMNDSRQAIMEAAEKAGLKVLKLLQEPTSAGYAYTLQKGGDRNYIVFDWGHGTFDVSIQRVSKSQVTTLATEGIQKLGGRDIDVLIKTRVIAAAEKELGHLPSPSEDPMFHFDLDQKVRSAKISLSNRKKVPVVVAYKGNQAIIELEQEKYHQDITPLIQQTLDAMQKAMSAAGLTYQNIDNIVPVGGTSKIPLVLELLTKTTGITPSSDIDPQSAIAYGAAYQCAVEMAKRGTKPVTIPAPDLFAKDVLAHSVGCAVVEHKGTKRELFQAEIIPQNTPIPCQRSDVFYLEHENQTEARIEILEGAPGAKRDNCLLIGELLLENLPKETTRTPRIVVDYSVNADGLIQATCTDKISGKTASTSVDYKRGTKPKQKPNAA